MHISPTSKPQIFITMGDPAGIGPEVTVKSMASPEVNRLAIFVVIGDEGVMRRASEDAFPGGRLTVHRYTDEDKVLELDEDSINILDPGSPLEGIEPGRPTDDGARKALDCIDAAVKIMRDPESKTKKAMVTAPVSKAGIARIHKGFTGHTEFLQGACSAPMTTMVMVGKNLCVVPVTRHIPLSEVASTLTVGLIIGTLRQVVKDRKLISSADPARIGVCGLNPHCGENGNIGREEIGLIAPAVEEAKKFYDHIEGPISADAVFYSALKKDIDIVVGMYHDQCLAPFKMVDFDNGVNMTLGLDWVRTSPDHGTAFNIAGKGIADPESMKQAIKLAARALS